MNQQAGTLKLRIRDSLGCALIANCFFLNIQFKDKYCKPPNPFKRRQKIICVCNYMFYHVTPQFVNQDDKIVLWDDGNVSLVCSIHFYSKSKILHYLTFKRLQDNYEQTTCSYKEPPVISPEMMVKTLQMHAT